MLITFCKLFKSNYLLSRCFCSNTVLFNNKYQDLWQEELNSIFKMPKSKEYLSSDESTGSSHSEDEKPKKKKPKREEKKTKKEEKEDKPAKKASSSKADEEEPVWEIGNKKQITVRTWKGKLYIDIREMYLDKDGDLKPGRKGISLTPENYNKLKEAIEEIDEAVARKA